MRDKIFFSSIIGFSIGIFGRSFIILPLPITIFLFGLGVAFLGISLLQKSRIIFPLATCIIAIGLGVFRFGLSDTPAPMFLERSVGEKVELTGVVIDDIDHRDTNAKISVSVENNEHTEKGTILVTVDPHTLVSYGDELKIIGKLQKPKNFTTDQEKEFDYIHYLWKDDIRYTMSYAQIEILSSGHGNIIKTKLFWFKNVLLKKFSTIVPYPESGLLGGILIGSKEFLSGDLRTEFINTGTIHIVALSGYNVSIVAESVMKLFRLIFSQTISVILGIFSIILFVIMTGASATAVRAGIMGVLVLWARITGRPYVIFRALLLAGTIMVLWNPRILVFDVSFQLSFIATLGLIFVAPIIERWFMWIPWKFLREIASATISAQIAVLPFLLYKMGVLSIVALPINILILPFIPFAMLLGSIAGFLSFISHFVAIPFGYITYGFLNYIFQIVHLGSTASFASFDIKSFPLWITLICYTCIVFWIIKKTPKTQTN